MTAKIDIVPVQYVGQKSYKTDNVNHTRTVWTAPGDTQPYPASLAASLLRHPGVWKLGKADAIGATQAQDADGVVSEPPERSARQAAASKESADRGPSLHDDSKVGPDPARRPGARALE